MDQKNKHSENVYGTMSNLHFQCYPDQNTNDIFQKLEETALQFVWNQKRPRIAEELLKRKNKAGGITLLDFKL